MLTEEEIGRGMVRCVHELALLVVEARRQLGERRKAGEACDATAIAGYMARALVEAGGSLGDGNPNRLRWPIEEQRPLDDPRGFEAAVALAQAVAPVLERRGKDPLLEDVGAVWPEHATRGAADAALGKLLGARAADEAQRTEAAHVERLRQSKLQKPRAPTLPRVTPDGPKPDGEWLIGENFAEDVPTVG